MLVIKNQLDLIHNIHNNQRFNYQIKTKLIKNKN